MSSLKKFDYRIKDNRKRNIFLYGIVLVVVTIIGVKLYQSKAQFTSTTNELNLANGKVRLTCTDKVKPGYNRNLTEYVKKLYDSDVCPELVDDETIDNNLRYIGATPDNYVWFNDELWRIIGVMNNVEGGTESTEDGETRIKIIRDESLGEFIWDNKQDEVGSSTSDNGSNDWSDSQLMMMLNPSDVILENWQNQESKKNYKINTDGTVTDGIRTIYKKVGSYYNHEKGYIPNKVTITEEFKEEEIDFSEKGLTEESKKIIDKAIFYLGSFKIQSDYADANSKDYYNYERGNSVYINNPISWTGYIGLMYPSDYGYATSGSTIGSGDTREICLTTSMYNWNSNIECKDNDWLYDSSHSQWTISSL